MPAVPTASRPLPRILLVETHDMMRRLQLRFLSPNFAVDFASTGEEAFEMALGKPYAAIIIDVTVNGRLSAVEVMQGLKSTPQHRGTAMIATAPPLSAPERDLLIRQGFDFYLAKPFRYDVLLDVVRHAVAQSLGLPTPTEPARPADPTPPAPPVSSYAPPAPPEEPVRSAPPAVEPTLPVVEPVVPVVEPVVSAVPPTPEPMDPALARLVEQLSRDTAPVSAPPSPYAPPVAPAVAASAKPEASLFRDALAGAGIQSPVTAPPATLGWTSLSDL